MIEQNENAHLLKQDLIKPENKVSVILTVLNEGQALVSLLDSLLSQSREADEIVIVDGGSTDTTHDILQEYANHNKTIMFYTMPGVNIARGRNIAISHATGNIIAVTDGGCLPDKDWLKEIVRPLIESDIYGAVAGTFKVDWQTRFEYFAGILSLPQHSSDDKTRMFYGRSSAFRKSTWEAAGGYPEWLYTAEDTLFAHRVLQLNYPVALADKSILAWRPRPTLRKLAKMFFLYGRGQGRINQINMKGTRFWLRNHAAWIVTLILGLYSPWIWILALFAFGYMYRILISPQMPAIRKLSNNYWRELYVPLIIITRNISTNIGNVVGAYEYSYHSHFREKLAAYMEKIT